MGFRLKRFAKRFASIGKKLAPSLLNFVPGAGVGVKAWSALKSAGVDTRRLKMASEGKLVSAIPLSEVAIAEGRAGKKVPPAKKTIRFNPASLSARPAPVQAEAFARERGEKARLAKALGALDAEQQAEIYRAWKASDQTFTWPQYVAKELL
jgi:hypothetical protein